LWKTKNHNNFDRVTIINNDHVPSTLLLENKNFATPIQVETVEDLLDGYVLFPHAALLASDQTQIFASLNNLELFPPDTMLLFSKNTPSNSLFYDSFKVIDIKPYDIKKLATYIEQLNWNSNTELKKKNFPIEPESLRAKLKLLPYSESNTQSGTVIFTQFNKQQIIIFSKRQ
jgi:glycerophosphoryl diester phosphodiesterase